MMAEGRSSPLTIEKKDSQPERCVRSSRGQTAPHTEENKENGCLGVPGFTRGVLSTGAPLTSVYLVGRLEDGVRTPLTRKGGTSTGTIDEHRPTKIPTLSHLNPELLQTSQAARAVK